MIAKTIDASLLRDLQIIPIGRQMEDYYRDIIFDCSGFDVEVSQVTLVHQRSKDIAPYAVTEDIEELRQKYTEAISKYNNAEARAERLDRIKARITELRDEAKLSTTKAIYSAILELFEG